MSYGAADPNSARSKLQSQGADDWSSCLLPAARSCTGSSSNIAMVQFKCSPELGFWVVGGGRRRLARGRCMQARAPQWSRQVGAECEHVLSQTLRLHGPM